MISDKKPYLAACKAVKASLTDTSGIDSEIGRLEQELEVVAGLTKKFVMETASTLDEQEFTAKHNVYVDRYNGLKTQYEELQAQKREHQTKVNRIDRFIKQLSGRDGLLKEFDPRLWLTAVEYATVHPSGAITFRFFNGLEVNG